MDGPSFYNPDILSQLPDDLLSFPLPMNSNDQEFPSTFLSQCEENSSNGLTVSDFYKQQVSSQDIFLPQNSLSTPLPTPDYCTPPVHPLQSNLEVNANP